jgi:SNF2 domain-containing protein/helicase-like protein/SNF2 helicase protein
LSLPSTSTARRAPLELTFVPRGAEEPLMGFYSVSPLTPGGWTALLDERGLPHNLRRLPITIAAGGQERSVDTRCLPMLPALAYLLSEPNGGELSPSVKAWRLVARLTERVIESGGEKPALDRFAAAFPPLAHAALSEHGETADTVTAQAAVEQFVRAAMRSLAAAVRDPRLLTAADSYHDQIDLAVLQPALRSVAPDLGAVAPIVNLRQSLEPLELVLQLPPEPSAGWPLELSPPDFDRIKRAASILPLLASVRDGRAELTLAQVAELRTAAPALEFSGARVRLPDELGHQEELELDAAGLSFAGGPLSLGGVVEYDLHAALGGVQISEDEFRALAAATQPLVRIGGEWRLLGDRALRRARQLAQLALHGAGIPALTALGATLAGRAELRGFEVEIDPASAGELEALARQLRDPELRAPVDPQPEFHGVLRPYQHSGLGWLVGMRRLGLGALLADDMGLGKTVQLIAYLLDRSDRVDSPALIVCPASVLGNWQRELHRFAPGLSCHIHHGPDRTRAIEGLVDVDVVLTSYSLLPRDRRLLAETEWRVVVLDEAQQVKNPLTRGAQAARALQAHHRIALTGTPIENRLDELWSILHFLNPGLLDTRNAYRRHYATPIEKQRDPEAAERLRRITGPFILRRHKSDPAVLPDLPPRQESNEYCTLTVEQAALYQATIDAMLGEVRGAAGIERRGHVLALLTRLKQVCNHPAQALGKPGAMVGRSGKLDRLTEMLAEAVDEGDSALVFTQYAVMGRMLSEHLTRALEVQRLYLDGSTPIAERERVVDGFQAAGDEPRVLVMSLKAGGLGLNLTNASHVFHFDRWWNPAVEDQASDRAHRIGQTRVVQVHRMICAGTIEERIDELIEAKRSLATSIVDRGVEGAISELSDEELADLVELRQ